MLIVTIPPMTETLRTPSWSFWISGTRLSELVLTEDLNLKKEVVDDEDESGVEAGVGQDHKLEEE